MDLSNLNTGIAAKIQESTSMSSPVKDAMDKTDKIQPLQPVAILDPADKAKEQKETPLSAETVKDLTE